MRSISMEVNDTKKCRIIPKKYNFIPDLLLNNKRIEKETVMEINKAEICRAMTLATVYMINDDGTEVLLTPENFYLKPLSEDGGDETPSVVDKTELQTLIAECESVDQSKYTAESYAALQTKLTDAKAILAKDGATQDEVTSAKNDLQAVKDGLILVPAE